MDSDQDKPITFLQTVPNPDLQLTNQLKYYFPHLLRRDKLSPSILLYPSPRGFPEEHKTRFEEHPRTMRTDFSSFQASLAGFDHSEMTSHSKESPVGHIYWANENLWGAKV